MSAAMTSSRSTAPAPAWPPDHRAAQAERAAWADLDRSATLSSSLELGAFPASARFARQHARQVLTEWGLAGLADDAESVVDELVLNAVQATARAGLDTPVTLTLLAGLRAVLIAVRDAAPGRPARADQPGKVVWALIRGERAGA